jgi:hypothetical protein
MPPGNSRPSSLENQTAVACQVKVPASPGRIPPTASRHLSSYRCKWRNTPASPHSIRWHGVVRVSMPVPAYRTLVDNSNVRLIKRAGVPGCSSPPAAARK